MLGELRERGRWLLVFDNAENPADITGWLPGGGGHVLITSRERTLGGDRRAGRGGCAGPGRIGRAACRTGWPGSASADADRLADQLGDLPLAVAQAARVHGRDRHACRPVPGACCGPGPGSCWTRPRQDLYPRSLAAATRLIADRLARDDPAAAQLASLCAFLAPEPVPEDLFTSAPGELPGELAARAADPLAWRQTLAHLARQSLARIDQRGLVMHRLTQAILRDRLTPEQAAATRACSGGDPGRRRPRRSGNPVTWPRWAQLMPHLLAADLAATGSPGLRGWPATRAGTCWPAAIPAPPMTLPRTCASTGATGSAMTTSTRWAAAHYLAWALRDMGRYAEARELDEDTLARCRRVLGEDHPDTLASANNLAIDLRMLGEHQAARELDEDTLARRRRVLGEDHPDTLTSASNLAIDLTRPRRVSGGPRAGRGHPGPLPPGARRGPPRHPGLGEQPRHRPERCSASIRRPASWTRTPWPAAAACSARTTPTPWPRRATSPST